MLYLMCQDGLYIICPGNVYYYPVIRMEIGSAVVSRWQVYKLQPGLFHFRIGMEQFIVFHIIIQINPFTQCILFLQSGCQFRQFRKTFPLRLREHLPLYLPVKKIFKLPVPGLFFQQA